MNIPQEVQDKIDALNRYKENDQLEQFMIFHLHPKELCYPNGYYDSRWMEIIGYNYNTDYTICEKRVIGQKDGIRFTDNVKVDIIRIFADGSTLIRFKSPVYISGYYQELEIDAV